MTAPGSPLFWLVVFWGSVLVGVASTFAWALCRIAADADRRAATDRELRAIADHEDQMTALSPHHRCAQRVHRHGIKRHAS